MDGVNVYVHKSIWDKIDKKSWDELIELVIHQQAVSIEKDGSTWLWFSLHS